MRNRYHLALVLACFFVSGAAGLVYEVVWERYLRTVFGCTTGAVAAVLAVFMGGLALGGWLFGRLADRSPDRLALYARLELGCTALALAFPWLFGLVGSVHAWLIRGLEEPGAGIAVARLMLSAALLLPPTMLMGGTLPVMARHLGAKRRLATLYAVNSLGAAAGCVAAGFVLIDRLGLTATLNLAALLNATAAMGALAARVLTWDAGEADAGEPPGDTAAAVVPAGSGMAAEAAWPLLAGLFLSGAASMGFEIGWTRVLAMILGSSVHAFALMLAGFIVGIAIGSWSLSAEPVRDPALGFARGQVLIGLLGLLSIPFASFLPNLCGSLRLAFDWSFGAYQLAQFCLCLSLMLPVTFLFGRTFPLGVRAVPGNGADGARVGLAYGVNTAGTLAGSVLAGLVLIPAFGVRHALELSCTASLLAGGLVAARALRWPGWPAAAVGAAAMAIMAVSPAWDLRVLTRPTFRVRSAADLAVPGEDAQSQPRVIYYREDAVTTVSVEVSPWTGKSLRVNSKPDASTSRADMQTQRLLAHVPLVLRPPARDLLVIGLGSGVTVAAALLHPLRFVDCVELSPAVVEASRLFSPENREYWKDPRVRIHVNDARGYLAGSSRRFDCIISEPSNPWVAGVASLFTAEFFALCRQHLQPGGVMAQWVQTYESSPEIVGILMRTFRTAFPHAQGFLVGHHNLLLVGSAEPFSPDFVASRARMADGPVRDDLGSMGYTDLFALLATNVLSEAGLAEYAGRGVLHTDDYPLVDYLAPRAFFDGKRVPLPESRTRFQARDTLAARYTTGRPPSLEQLLAFADAGLRDPPVGPAVIDAALRAAAGMPSNPRARRIAAEVLLAVGHPLSALENARAAAAAGGGAPAFEVLYVTAMAAARLRQPFYEPPDVTEAVRAARELVRLEPGKASRHVDLAVAYQLGERLDEAAVELKKARELVPGGLDRPSRLRAAPEGR
ncbi:MAG: fused MFS/spermidine synthase [Candidatus Riflebacteria bacterium]|nr:fused MFS/spermidine synthase [Candidatus Riflebacteria bacterium]